MLSRLMRGLLLGQILIGALLGWLLAWQTGATLWLVAVMADSFGCPGLLHGLYQGSRSPLRSPGPRASAAVEGASRTSGGGGRAFASVRRTPGRGPSSGAGVRMGRAAPGGAATLAG